MSKRTSQNDELIISNYYFAAYPLSIQFKESYQNSLYLEFEKNLQIMLKFQLNKARAMKGEIIRFPNPQKLNHFRILSQKNLQYQWSLYSHQTIEDQHHEQCIESQKINYRNYWNDFKLRRDDKHIIFVQFKNIKCKLQYIFLIATNPTELLSKIKNHYNNYINPSIYPLNQGNASFKKNQNKIQKELQSKISIITGIQAKQSIKEQQLLKSSDIPIQSINLEIGKQLQQSITLFQGKRNFEEGFLTPEKNQQQLKASEEKKQLKLSRSEIELSNQIMQDVQNVQSSVQKITPRHRQQQGQGFTIKIKQTNQQQIQQHIQLPIINNRVLQPFSTKKQDAQITMTSSTLLNQKGDPIIPFYKNKIYIMIFVIFLLIIATGLALHFINKNKEQTLKPQIINKNNKQKKKMEKENTQKVLKTDKKQKVGNKQKEKVNQKASKNKNQKREKQFVEKEVTAKNSKKKQNK